MPDIKPSKQPGKWTSDCAARKGLSFSPGGIALIYAAAGTGWIGLSDYAVFDLLKDPETVFFAELIKGILYVALTTVLVYWLAKRALKNVQQRFDAEQLESSQHLLKAILSSLGEAVLIIDPATRSIVQCNPAAERLFGYSRAELIGQNTQILHESRRTYEEFGRLSEPILTERRTYKANIRMKRKNSGLIDAEVTVTAIDQATGWETGVISIIHDVTAQKKTEHDLEESRQQYFNLVEGTPDLITRVDKEGRFLFVNHAAHKFLGLPAKECIGLSAFDFLHPDDQEATKAAFSDWLKSEEDIFYLQNRLLRDDGQEYTMAWSIRAEYNDSGQIAGFASTARDISENIKAEKERKFLEAQLRQKYKMEAVGVLAGGMAHNFNNNLAIIIGNLELAQSRINDPDEVKKRLDYAKIALLRSRDLIKQIMIYSRQDEYDKKALQATQIVEETLSLLHSTIPSTVHFQRRFSPAVKDVRIHADATRIQESLINLCTNAVHAMNEKGEINISLDIQNVETADIPALFKSSPGEYLRIRVQDNGSGIPEENIEKIFDPFFTTKPADEGTGMGLSTVRGVAEQHGGFIKVRSDLSRGTLFELYFPVSHETQAEVAPEKTPLLTGSERVLLIEDDQLLAETGKMMLSELGYRVTTITRPMVALEKVKEDPLAFDLVITDQTMPDITGTELAVQLKKIRADLPVILCTGYSSQVSAEDAQRLGVCSFCMKPLSMANLSQTIRNCLAQQSHQ